MSKSLFALSQATCYCQDWVSYPHMGEHLDDSFCAPQFNPFVWSDYTSQYSSHIYTPLTFFNVKCRIYTIHHPECQGFHTLTQLICIQHYSHSHCCCLQYTWIVRTAITEASLLACWLFTDVKANLVSQKISKSLVWCSGLGHIYLLQGTALRFVPKCVSTM